MKLSDLISYVNVINNLTTSEIASIVDVKLRSLLTDMHNNGMTPDLNAEFLEVTGTGKDVLGTLRKLDNSLSVLKEKLKVHKADAEVQALRDSYQLYVTFQNRTNRTDYMFK